MALIQCPDCSTEVSKKAYECPKCGRVLRKPQRGFFGRLFLSMFLFLNIGCPLILFIGYMIATDPNNPNALGATIGTAIGAWIFGSVWFFGFVILGILVLLTRPSR